MYDVLIKRTSKNYFFSFSDTQNFHLDNHVLSWFSPNRSRILRIYSSILSKPKSITTTTPQEWNAPRCVSCSHLFFGSSHLPLQSRTILHCSTATRTQRTPPKRFSSKEQPRNNVRSTVVSFGFVRFERGRIRDHRCHSYAYHVSALAAASAAAASRCSFRIASRRPRSLAAS